MTTARELIEALQQLPEEAMDSDVHAVGCCGNCYVDIGMPIFHQHTGEVHGDVYLEGSRGELSPPRPKLYQPSEEELELRAKGLLP